MPVGAQALLWLRCFLLGSDILGERGLKNLKDLPAFMPVRAERERLNKISRCMIQPFSVSWGIPHTT